MRISEVHPDTAAARAGLRVGDLVVQIGGAPVATLDDLVAALGQRAIGDPVPVHILRGAERIIVEVRPTEMPEQA